MDIYHFLFKFVITGNTTVGKTCITLNFTEKKFQQEHDPTIGVEFGSKLVNIDDKIIKYQIWDTTGQDNFRPITQSYYGGSIAILFVFDLTKRITFEEVKKWYDDAMEKTHEFVDMTLIGNKSDLEKDRQVTSNEAEKFAKKYNMHYYEISAKTGENIDLVFIQIGKRIIEKIDKKAIDYTQNKYGITIGSASYKKDLDPGMIQYIIDNKEDFEKLQNIQQIQ